MTFFHFLITQFNLRNFPKSSYEDEDSEQWADWTRERINIFNKFCLPSILNQSKNNFTWLIFFDTSTRTEFNPFINNIKNHKFIKICFCNGYQEFYKKYMEEVHSRIPEYCQWIITTRLDNDDVLHRNAIKVIQNNFVAKEKYLISLASGYILDLNRNVLAHYFYPMSPFISLIESVSKNNIGIFDRPHSQWQTLRLFLWKEIYFEFFRKSKRSSRFILKQPLWIQLFHGKNVSNSFYRGLPVIKSQSLTEFGIEQPSKKLSIRELSKFWDYVHWKRYFKCMIIKLILNK
jgi:hypothetical protein